MRFRYFSNPVILIKIFGLPRQLECLLTRMVFLVAAVKAEELSYRLGKEIPCGYNDAGVEDLKANL